MFLIHLGWQPIVRSLEGTSVLNALIDAYDTAAKTLAREQGGDDKLKAALWKEGFEFLFKIGQVGESTLSLNHESDGSENQLKRLFSPVCEQAQAILLAEVLRHRSQIDLAVQALFGFPLSKGSFSEYFKVSL